MFELPQGLMRFVLMHQAGSVELLIMFADQCLNVNERTCTTSQSDPHTPLKPEQGKANRS